MSSSVRHTSHKRPLDQAPPRMDTESMSVEGFRLPAADESLQMITRLGTVATAYVALRLEDQYNRFLPIRYPDILLRTSEHQALESLARTFVADTVGVAPVGEIYWQNSLVDAGYRAAHSGAFRSTFIKEGASAYPDLKLMNEASTLVHELAHSTGNTGRLGLFVTSKADGSTACDARESLVGDIVLKVDKEHGRHVLTEVGDFFEEGFAEETAARFREQLLPDDIHAGDSFFVDGGTRLPSRFFDANYHSRKDGERLTTESTVSIYAAHALTLLSTKSGVDLYALQCTMRVPEQKAAAKKEFIHAINSVQDGLYQELRDLEYTQDGFTRGLQLVKQAKRS